MEKDSILEAAVNLLGATAKDKISGITGVVSSVCFDLYGCVQASLAQKSDDKGAVPASFWLDVSRLELQVVDRVMPVPSFASAAGALHAYDHGPAEKAPPPI